MNREQYLEKRQELLDSANALIDEGKVEDANAVMGEIEKLDAKYEEAAQALANLNALNSTNVGHRIASAIVLPSTAHSVNAVLTVDNSETVSEETKEKRYMIAWAKRLQNKPLDTEELQIFNEYNPQNELDTGTSQILIPKTVAAGIWEKVSEMYPFYNKTSKLNVRGNFEVIKEDSGDDAAWYLEEDETADGNETFTNYQLTGCELSRSIRVSWKLREMAIEDFIPYIQRKLAKKMGKALAHGCMTGKGKPGKDDSFKPEPLGVITALKAEEGTPRVIQYTTKPTYDNILKLLATVKSGYKTELYATRTTIFNYIATIVDKNGRPYFVADTSAGGVGRILGYVVQEDDSVPEGAILCGDGEEYLNNFNKNITLDQDELKRLRKTDYIAYAIADGAPNTLDAFSYLEAATA